MGLPTPILTLKQLKTFAEIFQEQLQPQTKTAVSSKVLRRLRLLLVTYDPKQSLKTFCASYCHSTECAAQQKTGYKIRLILLLNRLEVLLSTAGKLSSSLSKLIF